jgi:hypothetical protein
MQKLQESSIPWTPPPVCSALAASQRNTTDLHAAVNSTLDIKRRWRAMSPGRGCKADISRRPAGHLDAVEETAPLKHSLMELELKLTSEVTRPFRACHRTLPKPRELPEPRVPQEFELDTDGDLAAGAITLPRSVSWRRCHETTPHSRHEVVHRERRDD